MKKTLYFIILLIFSSCEKYLDVKPTNVVALQTYEDVKALMGAHLRMCTNASFSANLPNTTVHYINNNFALLFHFYSDDLETGTYLEHYTGRNNRKLYNNSMAWKEEEVTAQIWKENYANIGFYNTIVDELANIPNVSIDEANVIKGEAKFLRAWNLFKLLQYFSPYKLDEYGIPVNFNSQAVSGYDAHRRTQTEIYQIILSELDEILNYETEPTSYNFFYDKKMIHALMAQVYLFKGGSGAGVETDYTWAILHAKEAMEGRTIADINEYSPFPRMEDGEYGVFKDKPYALLFDTRYDGQFSSNLIGIPDYQFCQFPSESLYSLFSDQDIRKKMFFGEKKEILKLEQINPKGDGSYGRSIHQFFTTAEMQLIIAESYARQGKVSEAKDALNVLQSKRIKNHTPYGGDNVLQEILNERRREFCYEYDMRWCDLIRTQKGWTRKWAENKESPSISIEDEDYRFCFPIPVNEELQYNKIEQNPGWTF